MIIKKTDCDFLDDAELKRLINQKFNIKRLDQIRDCFLVSCFTGLAYADLSNLSKEHLYNAPNGSLWIKINRKKTDEKSTIPVLKIVEDLIIKYEDNPLSISKNKLFPVSSNQRMNGYLKEIADICGIRKELTTHIARHTFATTVTLNNDIPIETVSKMLGYSSLKTTRIYARILDRKIENDMNKLKSIFT